MSQHLLKVSRAPLPHQRTRMASLGMGCKAVPPLRSQGGLTCPPWLERFKDTEATWLWCLLKITTLMT